MVQVQGLTLKGPARDVMVTAAGLAGIRQRAVMQHQGLMAGLLGEFPAAQEATCYAKRWVAGQLMSLHMPDEVVELLVAAVFCGCAAQFSATSVVCSPESS